MMSSYLNTVTKITDILFKGWTTYTTKDIVLASFLTFVFTFLFEVLKGVKAVVVKKRKVYPLVANSEDFSSHEIETTDQEAELLASLRIPSSLAAIKKEKMKLFVIECLLHFLTFAYAYMIMLVVMTYSVWFLAAVVLGSAVGFFVCTPICAHIKSKYSARPQSKKKPINEADIRQWI